MEYLDLKGTPKDQQIQVPALLIGLSTTKPYDQECHPDASWTPKRQLQASSQN